MEKSLQLLLILHIIAGITCFITGIIAIVTKKGSRNHVLFGKVYFTAMFIVIVSAVILSLFRNNLFLLLIASFSFYMAFAGVRSIRNKSLQPKIIDWILLAIGIYTAFVMIWTMNTVLLAFGIFFAINLLQEIILFVRVLKKQTLHPRNWLLRHIGMMLGSYIATVTAFLVTNVQNIEPQWLPWLAPTIIGTPIIAYYTRKISKQG